ncbi:MAG: hypothetical protein CMJ78_12680 [Planctomycetaceae bacterium]|nr:hypothetical protein [Planctomycetaceae bacterium]
MPVSLTVPTSFAHYADGQSQFELEGGNIAEVLANLVSKHPDLRIRVMNDSGDLYSYLPMFRNEEKLPLTGLARVPVADGDELEIITLASGG